MPHVLYLGGDSYPDDAHCEEQIISELTQRLGLTFTRQSELMPVNPEAQHNWRELASRYEQIEKKLAELKKNETIILIGRSSGSRVATKFAHAHLNPLNPTSTTPVFSNIAAVIGFAYPFRAPRQKIEPARFEHLADMTIPTLIIQGTKDEYGGADVLDHYQLSPSVELLSVDGDHGVNLSAYDWERTFDYITQFLIKAAHQHDAKRAEYGLWRSEKVFTRSVYYFGDNTLQEAKDHYAAYLRQIDKHHQRAIDPDLTLATNKTKLKCVLAIVLGV